MRVNFGVEIYLGPLDIPSDADFGFLNLSGENYFRWSVEARTGWKVGILADEWCDEITNSVNVERGGGVAELGGCVVRVVNTTQINEFLKDKPIYSARVRIVELPSRNIYQGRVSYAEWTGEALSLHIESLDAGADTQISGRVNGEIVPVAFGAGLEYAKGVLVEDASEVITIPSTGHEGLSFPLLGVTGFGLNISIRLASFPADWAEVQSFLNAAVSGGELLIKYLGQYRKVVSVVGYTGSPFWSVDLVIDASFSEVRNGNDPNVVQFYQFKKTYAFDNWVLDIGDLVSVVENGVIDKFSGVSFEVVDGNKLRLSPDAGVGVDKYLDSQYIRAYQDVFTTTTARFRPAGENSTSTPILVTDTRLSDGSIADAFDMDYVKNAEPKLLVGKLSGTAGSTTVSCVSPLITAFPTPLYSVLRYALNAIIEVRGGQGNEYYIIKSATQEVGGAVSTATVSIIPPLSQTYEDVDFICVDSISVEMGIRGIPSALSDGDLYAAMDIEIVGSPLIGLLPCVYLLNWDGNYSGTRKRSNIGSESNAIKNLPSSFGGGNTPNGYRGSVLLTHSNGWFKTALDLKTKDAIGFTRVEVRFILVASQTIRMREFGIGSVKERPLPNKIWASLDGRSKGALAKTVYDEPMTSPLEIGASLRQLTKEIGQNVPADGIGQDYPVPPRIVRGGQNGYNDPDIVEWLQDNDAAGSFEDASSIDLLRSLWRENFVVNWRDSDGLDGVAQILRAYNSPITKRVEFDDILPGSISVEEQDGARVFCAPTIRYKKNPLGIYDGVLSIRGVEFDLATDAEKAAQVVGSGKDEAGRALLWDRARALYLRYGNLAPLPDDIGILEWCKSAETADWYLERLLSWMGVNDSAVVSPRRSFRFTIPYEEANDQTGRKMDIGSRFILNLPHETNGLDYECICVTVTHDLVGLVTSIEAIGFIAADWPNDVPGGDYIQDEFSALDIWQDEFTFTNEVQDIWP